jgi:hypothetical protein
VPGGSDLAFGDSVGGGIVKTVLPAVFLVLAGVALAIVIFVVRLVKNSRRRSRVLPA